MRSPNEKSVPAKVIVTFLLSIMALTMLIPLIWMISASFKLPAEVISIPIKWIPEKFHIENYGVVWNIGDLAPRDYHFALSYFNSIKVTLINLIGALLTSTLAGYAFAKIKFRGREGIFLLYLSTMMIPQQVTLIPKFFMFDTLGMIGTHWPIILPSLVTPTGTFMMRQYFMQVPDSLREASTIDGASEFKTWWKIMIPLAKTPISSLAIIVFMWHWNNFLEPLVFLRHWSDYTIPVALTSFTDENTTDYNLVMAAAVSAMVPMITIFLIGQKNFVQGLTAGAVKG
ncbi:MAG: carbohydrate ABC transporter permease [Spirochaetaceae bacterium]